MVITIDLSTGEVHRPLTAPADTGVTAHCTGSKPAVDRCTPQLALQAVTVERQVLALPVDLAETAAETFIDKMQGR